MHPAQAVRKTALGLLGLLLIHGRAVRDAATCGIPSNARLHLAVRSRQVRRARAAARAELRERVAAVAAAVPSARLLCVRIDDRALRPPRYAPRIGGPPGGPEGPALTCTVFAEAYFGTDAAPEQVAAELVAGPTGAWRRRGNSWICEPFAHWESDLQDRPLRWRRGPSPRALAVIRRDERTEPAGWSISDARSRHRTLLRWSSHTGYLTLPRHPWRRALRRADAR
ncbi:hypothetical protein [Actinacidiphila bryophytorum]|uniref:Uncharacterized protein n=1 Tax=Actinacidiphila bryophytorum TaxID=1436133 RepID=A0A9W4H3I1_9ACTN|nr:hypothetical protein [Actinacidiphila bryophytorum]MBM9438114.1 hypothetical protein [Actinacidiphila bryophytorum]MBN6543631.1 hypothetical protein [Actinacidiphila bryophytorum]CAG7647430.1 hypothetical protein SBRY_40665 [Actinacidiphila bryophytorum]